MSWPHFREIVTVVDVIEYGACFGGVCEWIYAHKNIISGSIKSFVEPEIRFAAHSDGRGDGDGYGYGGGDDDGGDDGIK